MHGVELDLKRGCHLAVLKHERQHQFVSLSLRGRLVAIGEPGEEHFTLVLGAFRPVRDYIVASKDNFPAFVCTYV